MAKKKKKAAFFHLGDTYLAAKVITKNLDFDFIDLPKTNKESISKGLNVSPEFACFPFKSILGNFICAAELGADLIFFTTGSSITACQSADFAMVQQYILKKKGYKIDMVTLNGFRPKEMLSTLRKHKPDLTMKKISEIMVLFTQKFFILEDVDQYYKHIYFSTNKKKAENFKKKYQKKIDKTNKIVKLYKLKKKIKEKYLKYPLLHNPELKIGIIGDIFIVNDDYLNNNIFERIFELGAYAQKGISPKIVISGKFDFKPKNIIKSPKVKKYLKHNVGGYSQHTLEQAIKFAEEGFDGLIHIYPFNCMPETVVRSILPKISQDFNIPILYLPIDEQTGDAGFATRIEAFIDLIKLKKLKKIE